MAKVDEHAFNVSRHGKINSVLDVIPFDGEATIVCGIPIFADFVVQLQCGHEMQYVLPVGVLDGKAIHNKGKGNWSGAVPRVVGIWC